MSCRIKIDIDGYDTSPLARFLVFRRRLSIYRNGEKTGGGGTLPCAASEEMMADGTHISWTDATWNPVTGCSVISPGCVPCYAMVLAGTRLRHHSSRAGLTTMTKAGPVWNGEMRFNEQWLDQPLRWRDPRRIFVVAHGDLFHKNVPLEWIDAVFSIMVRTMRHEFQVLTKRTDRMRQYIMDASARMMRTDLYPVPGKIGLWPMPHTLLGTSIESQQYADERRPHLAALAAAGWRTWVSYEPALGPIDWTGWEFVRWIVSGGQSKQGGHEARPSHPDWHRTTRDFCVANSIAYHFKQHGAWIAEDQWHPDWPPSDEAYEPWEAAGDMTSVFRWHKNAGALLDGREWREFPA